MSHHLWPTCTSRKLDGPVMNKSGKDSNNLIDANRLKRVPIDLLLIDDAQRGLADIAAGRTVEADSAIGQLQQRRKALLRASGPSNFR